VLVVEDWKMKEHPLWLHVKVALAATAIILVASGCAANTAAPQATTTPLPAVATPTVPVPVVATPTVPWSFSPTPSVTDWTRIALPEDQLSIEVPTSWRRSGEEWSWSSPDPSPVRATITWASVVDGGEPTLLLPNHATVVDQSTVDLGWALGTGYDLTVPASAAAGGGKPERQFHVLVLIGARAYDFSVGASDSDRLAAARSTFDHILTSGRIAGAGASADQPLSRDKTVWNAVASQTDGTIVPILQPALLPTGLDRVRLLNAGPGSFQVVFHGPARSLTLGVGAFNPPLVGVHGSQQQVTVRGQTATFQVENAADPTHGLWVWWQEPGLWEPPSQGEAAASIFYLFSAEGIPPDVALDVVNSLVPPPPTPTPLPKPTARPTVTSMVVAGVGTVKNALIAIGAGTIGCGDGVVLVERKITPTRAPLTAATRELLSLKEHSYGQSGLVTVLDQANLQIESITVVDGKTTIRLHGELRLAGECDDPRVAAQLEAMARQFSTVQDVAISLNGKPLSEALSLR
jgi:hypothetical protein